MNFERNPRRIQEIRGRPIVENIYRQVFGSGIEIKRFEQEDGHVLDKHFAIDVQLELASGHILLGQEKFLSNDCAKYKTITVEYMQNPKTEERGDWFKLSAQFYFVGYFNENNTGFDLWVLIDWCKLVLETLNGNIRWRSNVNKNGGARASFKHCNMFMLPDSCVLYASFRNNPWDNTVNF